MSPEMTGTAPRTAIVMDDQSDICALALAQLGQLGVDAIAVTSKSQLRSALAEAHPQLILLDLALGDTDGVEVFALLGEVNYRAPVILMSGHSQAVLEHSRKIGQRVGLDIVGLLRKPFRLGDMRAALDGMNAPAPPEQLPLPAENADGALLERAIEDGHLEFWYQPKVELNSGRIVGAECLARIRHPVNGIVLPAAFLPGASDDALRMLLTAGAEDVARSARLFPEGEASLELSINVPGRMIVRPGLLDELRQLRERHCPSCRLTLEITETDLVDDAAAAQEFATRAALHGFGVSIDDFGNGYATFDRLRTVPFSELKLDRSVVHGCAADPALHNICRATVTLAHDFDAKAVAEGVEDPADLKAIRDLGFDLAQGYIFAAAMPFPDLLDLACLKANRLAADRGYDVVPSARRSAAGRI